MIVVVDGSNVVGAVPDGWWRDRRAAARRLLARLQCLHGCSVDDELGGRPIEVVTSDRALAADVRRSATVIGAKQFLGRLDDAGC